MVPPSSRGRRNFLVPSPDWRTLRFEHRPMVTIDRRDSLSLSGRSVIWWTSRIRLWYTQRRICRARYLGHPSLETKAVAPGKSRAKRFMGRGDSRSIERPWGLRAGYPTIGIKFPTRGAMEWKTRVNCGISKAFLCPWQQGLAQSSGGGSKAVEGVLCGAHLGYSTLKPLIKVSISGPW